MEGEEEMLWDLSLRIGTCRETSTLNGTIDDCYSGGPAGYRKLETVMAVE